VCEASCFSSARGVAAKKKKESKESAGAGEACGGEREREEEEGNGENESRRTMQLPQHHQKPSAHSCCSSWIRRSPPPSPPPHKRAGGVGRSRYACRLVPLLVLTVYSVVTVLRIPSSSLVVSTADSGKAGRWSPYLFLALARWVAVTGCWTARSCGCPFVGVR
jgi:hypothetical protein